MIIELYRCSPMGREDKEIVDLECVPRLGDTIAINSYNNVWRGAVKEVIWQNRKVTVVVSYD